MTTTTNIIQDAVRRVISTRNVAEQCKNIVADLRVHWEVKYEQPLQEEQDAKNRKTAAEDELRQLAVGMFAETGDSHPGPGVEIKMETKLDYRQSDALEWAQTHGVAILLDKKTFEKAAKNGLVNDAIVTITEQPKAFIATDLAKALETDER